MITIKFEKQLIKHEYYQSFNNMDNIHSNYTNIQALTVYLYDFVLSLITTPIYIADAGK